MQVSIYANIKLNIKQCKFGSFIANLSCANKCNSKIFLALIYIYMEKGN